MGRKHPRDKRASNRVVYRNQPAVIEPLDDNGRTVLRSLEPQGEALDITTNMAMMMQVWIFRPPYKLQEVTEQ